MPSWLPTKFYSQHRTLIYSILFCHLWQAKHAWSVTASQPSLALPNTYPQGSSRSMIQSSVHACFDVFLFAICLCKEPVRCSASLDSPPGHADMDRTRDTMFIKTKIVTDGVRIAWYLHYLLWHCERFVHCLVTSMHTGKSGDLDCLCRHNKGGSSVGLWICLWTVPGFQLICAVKDTLQSFEFFTSSRSNPGRLR